MALKEPLKDTYPVNAPYQQFEVIAALSPYSKTKGSKYNLLYGITDITWP